MGNQQSVKKPKAAFALAALLLIGSVYNWYLYFIPSIGREPVRNEIGLDMNALVLIFPLVASLFFIFYVKTDLGRMFFTVLLIDSVISIGWGLLSTNVLPQTFTLVNVIDLSILGLITLVFAVLERRRNESLFQTK